MTEAFKNSLVFKLATLMSNKWRQSFIRALFIGEVKDEKIKNSLIFSILSGMLLFAAGILQKFRTVISPAFSDSLFVSYANRLTDRLAKTFKASLLCRIFEGITEWGFDGKGIKLYTLFTFALLFTASIIPTMLCAAIALVALILYAVDFLTAEDFQIKADVVGFLIVLLAIVFGFYAVFSLTPKESIKIWMIYLVFMMSYFLIKNNAESRDKLFKYAATIVFSGFFVSLYGIYQRFFGSNVGHAWLDEEMFGDIALRVYSTLENPNVLGEYLLIVIPICAAVLWTRKTWLSRVFYTGILFVMLLCMLFTQSRGCWLGLVLAAAVFALLTDRRLVILAVAALIILPFVLPESIIARFASIGNVNDSSTSYRLFIWYGTLNMLRDFGIYGIGLGTNAFNKIYPFYSYSAVLAPHSHNIYLQLLCETGVVGLSLFAVIILFALRKMMSAHSAGKDTFSVVLSTGVLAGIAGFLLQGVFDYVWYNYRVFLIFWLVLGLGMSSAQLNKKPLQMKSAVLKKQGE